MNIYITGGTVDYLSKLRESQQNGNFLLMKDDEEYAHLLHEIDGDSIFKEGREYEVIDGVGELQEDGFAILNNIPVSDEGRSMFEYRFKNRARLIENEEGFIAIRVLRPINSDTYVIFTLWRNEADFTKWQTSKSFAEAHKNRGTSEGIDQQSIFPRPSYVSKYNVSTL